MNRRYYRNEIGCLVCIAMCGLAVTPARSDVKVVSRISGAFDSGVASKDAAHATTVTTLYRGNKVRIETNSADGTGGRVTIIDRDAGKIYVLSPQSKTYSERALGAVPSGYIASMMLKMDVSTTSTITPIPKARTIAGKTARGYAYKASIVIGVNENGNSSAASPSAGKTSQRLGTIEVAGEEWVTEAVKLPSGGAGLIEYARMGTGGGAGAAMPGFKTMYEKFSRIKGLPLSSTQNVTVTGMFGMLMQGGLGRGTQPGHGPARVGLRLNSDAVSVSEAPLPPALFSVPNGYKPAPPEAMSGRSKGDFGGKFGRLSDEETSSP